MIGGGPVATNVTPRDSDSREPARLLDAMFEARPVDRQFLSVWNGRGYDDMSWDDWRRAAERATSGVRALGIEPGRTVGCVLTNASAVCVGVIAIWIAGGVVASLPTPARGMAFDTYIGQLRTILRQLDADILLMEQAFASVIPREEFPGVRIVSFESLLDSGSIEPDVLCRDDVVFVQYSSGSTREPAGCLLTARAIEVQLDLLAESLSLDGAKEQGVMWLPLSHDMGLFGCLMLSFTKGMRLVVGTPERFLRSPGTWINDMITRQATIAAVPNFALDLAARAVGTMSPGHFPMQKCVIGGERVEASTLARADDVLGPYGFTWRTFIPAYGMAEAVLAVTMTDVSSKPSVVAVDSAALIEGRVELREQDEPEQPGVTQLVSTGRPLRGVEIEIHGAEVGEIVVKSPCLAAGYAGDPSASADRFRDGALWTRDLGFVLDGELFVFGRKDDMIVIAGRNVWARDVEAAICLHAPVRTGSCALVEVQDGDGHRLVVIAEPAKGASDYVAIAHSAKRAAYQMAGVSVHECLVIPPGSLPKTPSGKIQRSRCRSLTMSQEIEPLARVTA